jgi:hypothetical protein
MNNFKGIGPYMMRQTDKPVGVDFTEFIYTSQTLHQQKSSYLEQAIFDLHTQTHKPCRVDWTNFVHQTHRRESHINTTVSFALASFVLAEFATSSRNYFIVMKHLVS